MKLYVYIDKSNKYELPLAVATTMRELSRMTGVSEANIASCISKAKRRGSKSRFLLIEVEDDDDDE